MFAAITIFVTLRISTSEEISKLDKRELDLRTRELQIKEDSLQASVNKLQQRVKRLDKLYSIKESDLLKIFEQKSDSLDYEYFTRLKEIQGELTYIEKYMLDYANGYSKSFVFER